MPIFNNDEIDGLDFYKDDTDISFICNGVTASVISDTSIIFNVPIEGDVENLIAPYAHYSIINALTTVNRFCPTSNGNTTTGQALVANRLYVTPFIMKNTFNAVKIGLEVTVATASSNFYIGFYELDSNCLPTGAPIITSTALSATTTGYKEYTLGATYSLIPNKWYATGVLTDKAITVRSCATFNYLGVASTSTAYASYIATIGGTYSVLPTSPTMTALNATQFAPAIQIKL